MHRSCPSPKVVLFVCQKEKAKEKTFRLGYGPVDLAEAKLATSGLAVLMMAAPELVTDWTVAAPSAPTVKRNEIKR